MRVEALLAFAAALLALRLAGGPARRSRRERADGLAAWAAALSRVRARLGRARLGRGRRVGRRRLPRLLPLRRAPDRAAPRLRLAPLRRLALRAAPSRSSTRAWPSGIAIAVPLTAHVTGSSIPAAQDHLDFVPARLVALLGNSLGTIAVVVVALSTFRRRPLGNALVLAGVAVAAAGSAVAGLGEAESARLRRRSPPSCSTRASPAPPGRGRVKRPGSWPKARSSGA